MVTIAGHREGLHSLAIHPSGKLALSTGERDGKMCLWDLVKGRVVYKKRIIEKKEEKIKKKKERDYSYLVGEAVRGEVILFSPSGNTYLIVFGVKAIIYQTNEGKPLKEVSHPQKKPFLSAAFLDDDLFALGCEDNDIHLYDVSDASFSRSLKGHKARVRSLSSVIVSEEEKGMEQQNAYLASSSTDGVIIMWKINKSKV